MTADTPRDADRLPPVFQPLLPDDPRDVGGYRLFARLGAGGMGRVYLSYTPGGRPVALKVVRPEFAEDGEFRRRFAQEVSNAQRIHGLYTAQVIDSGGLDSDAPWLVTAYVPGPSLQQVVREHGALPARTVLLLMGGIAEALQAIHSVEVVHRDLKPANVLVAGDGPRVIDFGIARAADATALTGTGYRIGSPAFMSPEQAQGRPVTPATDVFALGALAAYVAGGTAPFGDGPDTAVLYRVVHEEPDLTAVPADLRELIQRCLAKSPEDRPKPAEIIQVARNHPEVGGQLRFGDDWLPRQVNTEITRRSDLPKTPPTPLPAAPATSPSTPPAMPAAPPPPAAAPTHPATAVHPPRQPSTPPPGFAPPPVGSYGAPQPPTESPTAPVRPTPPTAHLRPEPPTYDTPPPGPVVTAAPAPEPEPEARRKGGVSWKMLLTVALVMAVGGTAGGVVLMKKLDDGKTPEAKPAVTVTRPSDPLPPASTAPTRPSPSATSATSATSAPAVSAGPAKYTVVYEDRELTAPSRSYNFDLTAGKVAPTTSGNAWVLSPNYGKLSYDGDAYIPQDSTLTPEQCSAAVEKEPAGNLDYNALPQGRLFCVRSRTNGNIAIAKVVSIDDNSGSVKLSLALYRKEG
ncbi:serine/threonine-protein kinase [Kitasatospora brasiliensis]|uniref:serine/threonine-protein kinase n=1 Tax=Kitasatospora brasiliensis TaxID=3058040 RepID=UPI0029305064|nr:serine/threonine-protein kinase [Kitasatospora sp. K002]